MWPFTKPKPFAGGRTPGGGYMAGPKTLSQMAPPPASVSKVKPAEQCTYRGPDVFESGGIPVCFGCGNPVHDRP